MSIDSMYFVMFNKQCINKDLYNYVNEYIDKFYYHNDFKDLVDGKKYCGISVLNKSKYSDYSYDNYVDIFNKKIYSDIENSNIFYVDEDLFVYYVIHFLYDSNYAVSVVDFEYLDGNIEFLDAMLFDKDYYNNLTEDSFEHIDEFIFKV